MRMGNSEQMLRCEPIAVQISPEIGRFEGPFGHEMGHGDHTLTKWELGAPVALQQKYLQIEHF
jgi:hypothetical protein